MKRPTPACRAASSRLSVAVGPLECDRSGSRTERGTLGYGRAMEDGLDSRDGALADREVGEVALEPFVTPFQVGEVGAMARREVVHHAAPGSPAPAAPRPDASR